jgi:predicted transcriptional regulator
MRFHYIAGLKEDMCEIRVDELFNLTLKLTQKVVNKKRIEILEFISKQEEPKTITSMVDAISRTLNCPKSTVWVNINCLKELGFIKNGRGQPVRLTKLGEVILKNFKEVDKNGKRYGKESNN